MPPQPSQPDDLNSPPSSGRLRARLAQELDEPAAEPFTPPLIPDHTLLRRIGEGACGEVWLARNALGTLRAVKIVYRAHFKEDRPYEREFDGILKYEPISRSHEGLVQVLHVGRQPNCFYYVMELADDLAGGDAGSSFTSARRASEPSAAAYHAPKTLRSELGRRQRLSPLDAAQLTLGLAKALGHLHAHGLVHRDIKPSNVIFVAGRPKLADIGLVTDIGGSHSFVGTEGFIPPEGPGTPQADLYAVGKLLYELATGRDRLDFPQLPPGVQHSPNGPALLELNEIITRAGAPDPRNRYATATELQAELDLFLSGRSLRRARQLEGYVARIKRWAVAASLLLALTAAALGLAKREERRARDQAQAANERAQTEAGLRQRAQAAERQSEQQLYTALLEQARATVRSGDMGQRIRALDALSRAAAISNRMELRREVVAALALPDLQFERHLTNGPEPMLRRLDPSFERIAVCRGSGPVEIRTVSDNRLLASLPASTNLKAFVANWSRDGRYLAVKRDYACMGTRNDVEVWRVDHEPRRVLLVRDARANAHSLHPFKPELITGAPDGSVITWDLEQGCELSRLPLPPRVEHLIYSPEGSRIAADFPTPSGWGVSVRDAASGEELASFEFPNRVAWIEWHPEGLWLAATDFNGDVSLLNSDSGSVRPLGQHKAEAVTAVFSPDGDYLLTGGWERELICWDMRTFQRAMTITADSYVAQFRADGRACALFTATGVELHAFERPSAHRRFTVDLGPRLRNAAFSPDGRWLVASASRGLAVWDLTGGTAAAVAETAGGTRPFFTSDSCELFGSSYGDNCYRWRLQTAALLSDPPVLQPLSLPKPQGFLSLTLSSNQIVWMGTNGAQLAGLDEAPAKLGAWTAAAQGISCVSPNGRWLGVYRSYGSVLQIYRLPELARVASLTNQESIAGFSFSPSEDELGIASRSQISFYSTATWQQTRTAPGFVGLPEVGMLYQPDGHAVWLAKNCRTAGLYDTRTLEPLFFLPNGMFPLALSLDGRQLAVSLDMQHVQVWDLAAVRQHLRTLGLDWSDR